MPSNGEKPTIVVFQEDPAATDLLSFQLPLYHLIGTTHSKQLPDLVKRHSPLAVICGLLDGGALILPILQQLRNDPDLANRVLVYTAYPRAAQKLSQIDFPEQQVVEKNGGSTRQLEKLLQAMTTE